MHSCGHSESILEMEYVHLRLVFIVGLWGFFFNCSTLFKKRSNSDTNGVRKDGSKYSILTFFYLTACTLGMVSFFATFS